MCSRLRAGLGFEKSGLRSLMCCFRGIKALDQAISRVAGWPGSEPVRIRIVRSKNAMTVPALVRKWLVTVGVVKVLTPGAKHSGKSIWSAE